MSVDIKMHDIQKYGKMDFNNKFVTIKYIRINFIFAITSRIL